MALTIDGEVPGVGVLAVQVSEAIRRREWALIKADHSGGLAVEEVSFIDLRDAIREVLDEGGVDIRFIAKGAPADDSTPPGGV